MGASEQVEVTQLLDEAAGGNGAASRKLFEQVYAELKSLAANYLHKERAGHTLQPTALVHEVFLKLIGQKHVDWRGRTHFLAVAGQAMGRILADHARGRGAAKRGAGWKQVTLSDAVAVTEERTVDLVLLGGALGELSALDERQGRIALLRLCTEMTAEEAAAALGMSKRTVERKWRMARAWLRCALSREQAT